MENLQLKESLFTGKTNQTYGNKTPAWGTDDSNGNSLSYKDLLQEFKNQQNSSAQQEQQKNNQSANPQSALVSQKSAQEMLGALSVFSNTRNIVSQANLGASNSQESQNSNARSASITITDTPSARSQFKATGGKSSFVLEGDANGDGKVDKADCELMVKKHFGKNVSIDMDAADFDGDGRISAADLCDLHYIIETNQKTPTGITGDINNDGEVDIFDATKLANYLNGKEDASNIYNEDVDGNGIVDENDIHAISNLIEYGKVQKPNGISGDINNDGEVDIFDVTKLTGYLNGKEDATRVYNEDVDGNGVVDENDVNAISNLIEHGKLQKPNNITGDINNDGEVDLFDAMKLDNYLKGNEDITRVYNEDVDGNGVVDENDVKSVKNLIQYGSIHEPQPVIPTPPPTPSPISVNDMSISDTGISLIKKWEGLETKAYKPYSHEKYYTIGYGHYGADVREGMVITEAQAEAYLRQDLATAEAAVKRNCAHLNLNQNQYDALVSFTFNCGEGNLKKLVRDGRSLEEIAESMPSYRLAGGKVSQGLVNRRADEVALFNTPVENVQPAQAPSESIIQTYQTWHSKAVDNFPVYQDSALTNRKGTEQVFKDDPVDVLDETDTAYLIRYGVGTYPNYTGYKERWVTKDAISGISSLDSTHTTNQERIVPSGTIPSNPLINPVSRNTLITPTINDTISTEKAGWKANALDKTQVFAEQNLKTTTGKYECVFKDERVTIVAESNNAYKIKYSSVEGKDKERWIDKTALSEPTPPVSMDKASAYVQSRIEELNKNVIGFRDYDVFSGYGQCRGFANLVYARLFGLTGLYEYTDNNYAARDYEGSYIAGQLYNFNENDTDAVKQLFSNALPGAIVQMGRRRTTVTPHTAIVYSVDANGVEFYEANVHGSPNKTNVIKLQYYSWNDLAKKNQGFTIYLPNDYS